MVNNNAITVIYSIMNLFGSIILCHRRRSNLTQKQLADLAGVGKTAIFDIEHGKQTVQFDTLRKVCKTLNISITMDSPIMKQCMEEINAKG